MNEGFGKDFSTGKAQFSEEVRAIQWTAGLRKLKSCCPNPLHKNQLLYTEFSWGADLQNFKGFGPFPFSGWRKRCFWQIVVCLRDSRDFRHFRGFPVSEERSPLFFVGRVSIVIFAVFCQNHLFSAGDKDPVFQKHRFHCRFPLFRRVPQFVL